MFGLIICKKPRGKLPGNLLHGKWSSPSCSRGRLQAQTEQEAGLKDGGYRSTAFLQTSMVESSYAAEAFSQPCGCFVVFLFSPNIKKRGARPGLAHSHTDSSAFHRGVEMFPFCLVYCSVSLRSIKKKCHASLLTWSLKDSLCRHDAKQIQSESLKLTRNTLTIRFLRLSPPIFRLHLLFTALFLFFFTESKYEKWMRATGSSPNGVTRQYFMWEVPRGMRARIPGRSLRTLHSLATKRTFGALSFFFFSFFLYRVWFLFVFPQLPGQPCVRLPKSSSSPLKDMFSCAVAVKTESLQVYGGFGWAILKKMAYFYFLYTVFTGL